MMGNKKKRYTSSGRSTPQKPPLSEPDLSLDANEDPYWKISLPREEPGKYARYLVRFQREAYQHPEWAEDLISGIPTYYCVLGVLRGATAEQLLHHYNQEMIFSYYPDDIIERAYSTLSKTVNRIKYDEMLHLYLTISRSLPPEKKEELINEHKSHIERAKVFRRLGEIQKTYYDYPLFIAKGMPDIFTFSNLSRDCSEEDIKKYEERRDEVSTVIASIMRDPAKKDDFVFMSDFLEINSHEEAKDTRTELRKIWKTFDPGLINRIMYMALTSSKTMEKILTRCNEILQDNHDWIPFLPPSDKTFFSVLGIKDDINPLTKSEIEALLRSRYRAMERTPLVNLAYTVLKNQKLRDDYLWLQKNYEFKKLDDALVIPPEKDHLNSEIMDQEMEKVMRKILRNIKDLNGVF